MKWPAVIENIVLILAMCFLVWLTGSGWWCLMLLGCNSSAKAVESDAQDDGESA